MMFYFFMIPALLITVGMILRLRKLTKHDRVLYAFCQVRRDTMDLIRKYNLDLTKEDYVALRYIERATSDTIHDYNFCKVYIFNFRRFSAALRRLGPLETETVDGVNLKEEIEVLRAKYKYAL